MLHVVSRGPLHGYGIARRVGEASAGALEVDEPALYQALGRLEARGWLSSAWGRTSTGRRGKLYRLSDAGREHLEQVAAGWRRYAVGVLRVLKS